MDSRGLAGLAADPGALDEYRRLLIDAPLLPGQRAELVAAGWAGLCASPSEILSGPSDARRRTLLAAADSAPLPRGRALAHLHGRLWERPIAAMLHGAGERNGSRLASLGRYTPLPAVARLTRCAAAQW